MTETRKLNGSYVEQAMYDAGLLPEEDLYVTYSGRCMYGAECFGLKCTLQDAAKVLIAITHREELGGYDLADELASTMSFDDLGRGSVVYFPGFGIAPGTLEFEEDEYERTVS